MMKRILVVPIIFIVLQFVVGCRSSQPLTTESRNSSDSTRIEYRERIIKVLDTIYIEIPTQTAERTTVDSVSELETAIAYSKAFIRRDGSLFHSLHNKPQKMPIEATKEIIYRDSVVYKDKAVTVEKIKEVERELSWWQKTQIYGFWAVLLLVMLYIGYLYWKRKQGK